MFCKTCVRRNLGRAFLDAILDSGRNHLDCFQNCFNSIHKVTSDQLYLEMSGNLIVVREFLGN